jgi:hypothetical protein
LPGFIPSARRPSATAPDDTITIALPSFRSFAASAASAANRAACGSPLS